MLTRNPSITVRFAFTFLIVTASTFVRLALSPVIGEGVPFILYYLTVVLCAWYGRFWQGLIATIVSAIIAWYLFIAPQGSFEAKGAPSFVQLLTYLISGILISMLAESLHKARGRAEEAEVIAQKREEKLRESEERFRLATGAGRVGVWDWEIATNRVSWSESLYALHGLKHEEFDGTVESSASLVHPDDYTRLNEAVRRTLEQDAPYEQEFRVIRPNGEVIWIYTQGRIVRDATGRAMRMLGVTVDITERHELLAREQVARAEAQEANRLKDEFLATVSHELRSPLNGILGWVKLLQAKRLGEEDATRALDTIERNVRAQAKLIEDLLEVSRIITGKVRLDMQPLDLNSIIEVAVDSIRPLARAKDIELQATLDPLIGSVSGDDQRLLQIVGNLLSNAVKFTPRKGRIDLQLCRFGSQAEIAIRDTGKGISPDFLPHVFERFKQASTGSSRSNGGLGLGLAIVRHLVELHGGTVEAESQGVGKGSIFRVRLPLATAPQAVPTSRKPASGVPFECRPMLDGIQVLVLDDSRDARDLLSVILRQCAATVFVADTPTKARDILATQSVDLILSDIEMPDEDGYTFIRSVRKSEAARMIPAVALTAYARSEDRTRAMLAGFQYHLPKPVEPTELISVICNLTGRSYSVNGDNK